jgi:hypothetical protein
MSRAYGNQRFDAVDIRCQQSREMAEPLVSENQSRCREIESRRWLTQRAADNWESARLTGIFLAWSFFRLPSRVSSRPLAGNASRWAAEFGYNHAFEVYLLSKR